MKQNYKLLSTFFITFSLLISVSFASANPNFESLYAEMKMAMSNKDERAISALLAPDFYSEDVMGNKSDAKKMINDVLQLPKDPNKKSDTVLVSISVKDDVAKIRQRYTMHTSKIVDGATASIKLLTISDDIWKKINGKWLMLQTVTKIMRYSVNGKVISRLKHYNGKVISHLRRNK